MVLTNVTNGVLEERMKDLGEVEFMVKADNPPDMVFEQVKKLLNKKD